MSDIACKSYSASGLKLLDIVQSYSAISGGVKRYVHDKMRYIETRDDVEHVLLVPGSEDVCRREARTTIHEVESVKIPLSKSYRLLFNKQKILSIIKHEQPDVIEVGDAFYPAWMAIEAGRKLGIPVAGFYHSDYPRALGADLGEFLNLETLDETLTELVEGYLRNLYNQMTVVVCATKNFYNMLKSMGVENVVRIPLCTDTDTFKPKNTRKEVLRELGLDDDAMLLLYIGRLAGMKNIEEMLKMMERLRDDGKRRHLLIIGDGEERDIVEKAAADNSDITWIKYIADKDKLAEYYSAADLFVNASTHETFGLVSIEAQACGARVLGVRGGGMDETLEGEENLIMAENKHPKSLAEAVLQIESLEETDGHRKQRRKRIVENFSPSVTYGAMIELYMHLKDGGKVEDFRSD